MAEEREDMPLPCEQKETIGEIWDTVDELKNSTIRVETSVGTMVEEFRALSKDLRDSLLDGRDLRARFENLSRDLNIAFSEIRDLRATIDSLARDQIVPLRDWQKSADGSMAVFKGLQIAVSIAVGVLTLVVALR